MASIGTIWDRTVEFVRGNMGSVLPVVLATQFAPSALSGSLERLRAGAGGATALGLGVLTLATTLIALWGALYLVAFAAQPQGREAAAEARRIAGARFVPLIGISVVLLIVVAVLSLPGIALAYASGFDFVAAMNGVTTTPDQYAALGWALLYFVVLALVLLWAFARLLPINAVVAMERRGVGAIGRAFAMTRGMTFKLIGLLILYTVVAGVAVSAAKFVVGGIFAIFSTGGGQVTVGDVAAAIAVAAVSAALALYQSAFVGKLYRAIVGDRDEADVFA